MTKRVTALIGAGATFELDAPTTEELTQIIIKKNLTYFILSRPY